MTFEQFQATRKWCDDLGAALADARWEGEPAARGNLYLDVLCIEQVQDHWPAAARARGRWHLLIGRDEQISDDLESLERRLYEFARSEGYFDGDVCQHRDDGRGRCIDCGEFLPSSEERQTIIPMIEWHRTEETKYRTQDTAIWRPALFENDERAVVLDVIWERGVDNCGDETERIWFTLISEEHDMIAGGEGFSDLDGAMEMAEKALAQFIRR